MSCIVFPSPNIPIIAYLLPHNLLLNLVRDAFQIPIVYFLAKKTRKTRCNCFCQRIYLCCFGDDIMFSSSGYFEAWSNIIFVCFKIRSDNPKTLSRSSLGAIYLLESIKTGLIVSSKHPKLTPVVAYVQKCLPSER